MNAQPNKPVNSAGSSAPISPLARQLARLPAPLSGAISCALSLLCGLAIAVMLHYVLYRAIWHLDVHSSQFVDLRDPDQLQAEYSLFIPAQEVFNDVNTKISSNAAYRYLICV